MEGASDPDAVDWDAAESPGVESSAAVSETGLLSAADDELASVLVGFLGYKIFKYYLYRSKIFNENKTYTPSEPWPPYISCCLDQQNHHISVNPPAQHLN